MRLLLTGAGGRIGTAFYKAYARQYQFRLVDRISKHIELQTDTDEILNLDVSSLEACQVACQGIDVVIHLAANPSPDADFYQSLLSDNIVSTYNIFRAAKDQGCQRVIFASSAQVIEGYPLDVQVHPNMPIKPGNLYGVSKCFGEALASYFATVERISSIVVRIGNLAEFQIGQEHTARDISAFISEQDLVDLLNRCVCATEVEFAIVHGVSNNRFKRLDIANTRKLLGYQPRDDGFRILGYKLIDG